MLYDCVRVWYMYAATTYVVMAHVRQFSKYGKATNEMITYVASDTTACETLNPFYCNRTISVASCEYE